MGYVIKKSERLEKLPPYLFAEIDKAKRRAVDEGRDIIDLGVGDPDQPTPRHIIEALYKAALDPANHRYPSNTGLAKFRLAVSLWYKRRFNVELDPQKEILPLVGSKEGIAHIPLAFVNPGDVVLVPDPGYPPYKSGTILAGGIVHSLPLLEENRFLPVLDAVDRRVASRARLLFLNYPNNPTSAVADEEFFRKVVNFSRENNLLVCHDAAYSEIAFDGYKAVSFLQIQGAKDLGVEYHSLSKTYNMTGWRIGFVCGNSQIIEGLSEVKSNIDSGVFQAVQLAGIAALEGDQSSLERMERLYRERRDTLVDGLNNLGWRIAKPKATFYVWAPLPAKFSHSIEFSKLLLEKADIVATPGVGFGPVGEGYIRMALTVSKERLREAVERIKRII